MKWWLLVLAACSSKPTPPTTHDPIRAVDAGVANPDAVAIDAALDPKALLRAAELAAYEAAKPVFVEHCARCHTTGAKQALKRKLEHFEMDGYPLGGHHAGTIGPTIKNVIGLGGARPTMPYDKPGAVKADQLALVGKWADAWIAAEQGGAH